MKKLLVVTFISTLLFACHNNNDKNNDTPETVSSANVPATIGYNVVKIYPHDTSTYTEGLELFNGLLYESGGDPDYIGRSKLVAVNVADGKVVKKIGLDKSFFGEGISIFNNKIYQLTWKEHKVFVYDVNSFAKTGEFEWPQEGWGMTHDSASLIISTGSSNLYFVDPATFKIKSMITVTDNNGPVSNVNELEYVKGYIYANQYQTNYIMKINAETGKVEGKMDLTSILEKNGVKYDASHADVLNGIAYNAATNSFYITGKFWPALFELKLN
jgi:glutamine cyclotransferase